VKVAPLLPAGFYVINCVNLGPAKDEKEEGGNITTAGRASKSSIAIRICPEIF
jgi:hypothetical protein